MDGFNMITLISSDNGREVNWVENNIICLTALHPSHHSQYNWCWPYLDINKTLSFCYWTFCQLQHLSWYFLIIKEWKNERLPKCKAHCFLSQDSKNHLDSWGLAVNHVAKIRWMDQVNQNASKIMIQQILISVCLTFLSHWFWKKECNDKMFY